MSLIEAPERGHRFLPPYSRVGYLSFRVSLGCGRVGCNPYEAAQSVIQSGKILRPLVSHSAETAERDARSAFDRSDLRKRKRDAVLRVAAKAFNRSGFAKTSMDDVAAELGVSKPTVYQYFKNKQEILYYCHQLAMDNGEAGILLAQAHVGTGLQKLTIYLGRYMQGIFGDFGTCPVLTDVDSLEPDQREAVIARRARISAATADLIRAGVADGSIVECDPKLASLFALGAVNWIPLWYREAGPNTPEEIIQTFLLFLKSGFAKPD